MFNKRKMLLGLLVVIVACLTACHNNVITKNELDTTTIESNNEYDKPTEEKTEEVTTQTTTPQYVFDYDHIDDGFNRIAITFHTNSTNKMGLSWYTPNVENYGNDVEVISKTYGNLVDITYKVESGVSVNDENSRYHQTVVEGLMPGEEYFFRVGDKKTNKWSDYGTFKTATQDITEFSFIAITDTQSQHLPDAYFANNTIERALSFVPNPAFIMHSGDFVDKGSKEILWSAQMNASKNVLMNNIIAPAVGNHEIHNHSFWQHFKLEHTNNHKTTGIYYSYDYGKTHFVVLDTNKMNADGSSYIDDEQLEWLENDLQRARDNGAQWIIVNMHKGLYNVGEHADGEAYAGEKGARFRVGAVFEKYGVDLVFQGHDHTPAVTKPIKDGKASNNGDGVIYINTGSAGYKSYTVDETIMPKEYFNLFDFKIEGERGDDIYQNFATVYVTEEAIKVTMYEVNATSVTDIVYVLHELVVKK